MNWKKEHLRRAKLRNGEKPQATTVTRSPPRENEPPTGSNRRAKMIAVLSLVAVGAWGLMNTLLQGSAADVAKWVHGIFSSGEVVVTPTRIGLIHDRKKIENLESFQVQVDILVSNTTSDDFLVHHVQMFQYDALAKNASTGEPIMKPALSPMRIPARSSIPLRITSVRIAKPIRCTESQLEDIVVEVRGVNGAGETRGGSETIGQYYMNMDGNVGTHMNDLARLYIKDGGIPVARSVLIKDPETAKQRASGGAYCDPDYLVCRAPGPEVDFKQGDFGDGVELIRPRQPE